VGSMEAGAQQRRRGRGRRRDDPSHRTTRARGVSGGDSGSAEGKPISSLTGEAAIHTESRWEAAAIGDPDGQRELHQSAIRIWDGRRSVIRSIRCAANAFRF
jgi:hypothetical protein